MLLYNCFLIFSVIFTNVVGLRYLTS